MTDVTCTGCGATIGRGPGGLGLVSHWNKHRRDYRDAHQDAHPYPSKDTVREWLQPASGFNGETSVDDQQTRFDRFSNDS
jgi:hypothetical protein